MTRAETASYPIISAWLATGRHGLAPGDPRWDIVAARLVDEGLSGVALSLLGRDGAATHLTATARAALETDLNRVRASQVVLFDRLEHLERRFTEAGVEFLVHKGGALAATIYPRPEDRPMVDIDVLFRPGDWKRVRDLLGKEGYRLPQGSIETFWLENYFNLSVLSPEEPAASFDLHWSLTQEGRYHIATEELFARKVAYQLGSLTLHRLGNEELLLSLFLHLAYHYFEARLLWLYDMKRVMETWPIDWDRLEALASRWGLRAVVAFNLAYLRQVLPGSVPDDVERRFRLGAARGLLVSLMRSSEPGHLFRGEERRLNQFLIGLSAIDRPVDMARVAADKVSRTIRWLGRRPRRR